MTESKKHFWHPSLLVVLSILIFLPATNAVTETKRYIIGVEDIDYYPYYTVHDGIYSGAARDLLDAFASSQNIEFIYQPLPVKRLYADLFAGAIDFKFPDNPTWNRDAKAGRGVEYSGAVLPFIDGTLVRPDRVGKGLRDFGLLGTVAGFTPYAWLDTISSSGVKTTENGQINNLLRQVMTGRVDGAYVNVAVAKYQLRSALNAANALAFDPALPHTKGDYALSTTKYDDLTRKFTQWLGERRTDVLTIMARHGIETDN